MALLIVSFITSWKRNYPKTAWRGWKYAFLVFRESFFAFLLPVIVVFCLVAGIGTCLLYTSRCVYETADDYQYSGESSGRP